MIRKRKDVDGTYQDRTLLLFSLLGIIDFKTPSLGQIKVMNYDETITYRNPRKTWKTVLLFCFCDIGAICMVFF